MTRTLIPTLALAFTLGGCNGNDPDETGLNGNGNGESLGTALDYIQRTPELCDTFTNSEGETFINIEGAERVLTAYFELRGDGTVSGRFQKVLFANDAWQETSDWQNSGAADQDYCTVTFVMSGTHSEGGGDCGACDQTVTYDMTAVDQSQSDCPQGYIDDQASVLPISEAFWGLELHANGDAAAWDTERQWAPNGVHDDIEVVLWSGRACEWYGTGEQQ